MATDGEEETTRKHQSVQGMAKSQSAQTPAGLAQEHGKESTRTLQLLPSRGQ